MKISVTFRHLDSSDSLKDYVAQKLSKINKFFDGPIDASVVLSVEKFRQIAEMTVSSGKFTVQGTEQTDDMYQSIDKVIDKVERRVKRKREKVRRKPVDQERRKFEAQADREDALSWEERIVATENADAKPMSVEEAVMQMEHNLNTEFVVFTNASSQQVNVLYRRKDGNFGLVETQMG
jgi:putative sigma-54 modulation protein